MWFSFLNMRSIRSVTKKPPATFIMARTRAMAAAVLAPGGDAAYTASAPRRVIPDRAFIPDMRGVCKRGGTLEITLYPSIAEAKRIINNVSNIISNLTSWLIQLLVAFFHGLQSTPVHDLTANGYEGFFNYVIHGIRVNFSIDGKVVNKVHDVLGKHPG